MNDFEILRDSLNESLLVIRLGSTLDISNIQKIASVLTKANVDGYKKVIIDCSQLEFLSSAGIGVILSKSRLFKSNNRELILYDIPNIIMFVLTELDVADLLMIKSGFQSIMSQE